ncbi:MAG: class I SAM-dependent methyltransferase, partial [Planctomycetota bacterium]|nr:class I SAM-dependent methyltransferase [Planctomycetota bacterium]
MSRFAFGRIKMRIKIEPEIGDLLSKLVQGKFGFIDGGCGSGGSLEYCEKTFGRGPGIGFDSSSQKIDLAQASGYTVYKADMASVSLPNKCVSFVSFLDVLEHLPDIQTAEKILKNMGTVARDFIFIRHPSFEDME